jgi:aldehyde:ferredoxin oxidoreductase
VIPHVEPDLVKRRFYSGMLNYLHTYHYPAFVDQLEECLFLHFSKEAEDLEEAFEDFTNYAVSDKRLIEAAER